MSKPKDPKPTTDGGSIEPLVRRPAITVAMLRLPVGVRNLNNLVGLLTDEYGEGLTMREDPKGWLDIRQPEPPNH